MRYNIVMFWLLGIMAIVIGVIQAIMVVLKLIGLASCGWVVIFLPLVGFLAFAGIMSFILLWLLLFGDKEE